MRNKKMKDAIKTFIQEQRDHFDADAAGAGVWAQVNTALDKWPAADALERYVLLNRAFLDAELPPDSVWVNIDSHLKNCKSGSILEQFICEHRESFDDSVPDLRVWSELSAKLPENKPRIKMITIGWQRNLIRAAAAVTLLLIGLGAGVWYARSSQTPEMSMAQVSPEYAELEKHYEQDIDKKREKLVSYRGSQSADVMLDLDQLDHVMQELREELAHVPPANRQQVVRAMIENYKAKTAILERVLEHLEPAEQEGNNQVKNEIKNI